VAKKARGRSVRADEGIGPRQPCPCGSGRRYKACHGGGNTPFVSRTFAGLPGECDWVALREFVPAALAPVRLRDSAYDGSTARRTVRFTTVLPGIAPARVRSDGSVEVAVQVTHRSGDASRDLAEALLRALADEVGSTVVMPALTGQGARLQDLVDPEEKFEVQVLDGFDFWFDDDERSDPAVAATVEKLNASVQPTRRLVSVDAAYWTAVTAKEHLRWVLPYEEEAALTGLARLHAAGTDSLTPDSRLVGSFRACGLLVPVWDLPSGTGAGALEQPAAELAERLTEALARQTPLTSQERSARAGLATRQVTIR
jgi:uncharacterized protein DUF5926/SEC-C motif-containing protein